MCYKKIIYSILSWILIERIIQCYTYNIVNLIKNVQNQLILEDLIVLEFNEHKKWIRITFQTSNYWNNDKNQYSQII